MRNDGRKHIALVAACIGEKFRMCDADALISPPFLDAADPTATLRARA